MKIVHIITRLILGGAQENTLITCDGLADRGHDVTLITGPALGPEGELFERAQNQNYKLIVVDKMRRPIHPVFDAKSYSQIKKHLKKIDPDIVHTHSAKAGVIGRFAAYSLKGSAKKKPYVVHTIHGLAFHPYQNKILNRFYIAIEKAAAKKTDAFICVADAMTEKTLAAGIGKPEDFTTAYSAIDEDDFLDPPNTRALADFRKEYGIGDDTVVLVTIARLFELKGHEFVIESAKALAAKFENCVWLFVGDGNLAEQIQNQIKLASLDDKFKFTGLVDPIRIPLVIHSSDILVHCSLREGLARVLPQAMLCSKPVVSFDIDGAKEVVNKNTGRLVEPKNVQQLTAACAELIQSPWLRQTLGSTARRSVKEKFAPDTMVNTIEKVYNRLMNR